MKNIWIITKRDFNSYFTSPIAYIIISAFMLLMGWIFFWQVGSFVEKNYNAQNAGMMGAYNQVSMTDGIIRPLFGNINVILMFLIPFVTMRLFAEEKKQNTIQLLFTSPVNLYEVVLGKFFSAMLLICIMLVCTFVYPAFLYVIGEPDTGPILTSYLGTFFLAGCCVSLGLICSALTENQILAGAMTFGLALFFWLISWASMSAGPFWGEFFQYLSIIGHFENLTLGVISSADVVFYFSFIGFGIFLSHRILDSYRWR